MQDEMIVSLYWDRDESAIEETEKKYGHYLTKIAYGILSDLEDSKEGVNETYLKAWNSMPPQRPSVLSVYLAKLTRRASIDIFRKRNREKRQASEYALSLDELDECAAAGETTEQTVDMKLLAEAVDTYLRTLSPEARSTFVGRYFFMDSVKDVAAYHGMTQSKAASLLHRTRLGLKSYLEKEGFIL